MLIMDSLAIHSCFDQRESLECAQMAEPISLLDFSNVGCQAMIIEYTRDPKSPRRTCPSRHDIGWLANESTNCCNDRAGGPRVFLQTGNTNSCPVGLSL